MHLMWNVLDGLLADAEHGLPSELTDVLLQLHKLAHVHEVLKSPRIDDQFYHSPNFPPFDEIAQNGEQSVSDARDRLAVSGDAKPEERNRWPAISVNEANQAAMALAKKNPAFIERTAEQWANDISASKHMTCSTSTVHKTRLWKETMRRTGAAGIVAAAQGQRGRLCNLGSNAAPRAR